MPLGSLPHESWAKVYDLVYRSEFGRFYEVLTEVTIDLITKEVASGSKIVDYGAGTGRLSLPLAAAGYKITAVDSSGAMLRQLSSCDHDNRITTVMSKILDFESPGTFDFAICVFTIISYITSPNDLRDSFAAVYRSIKPGGRFLLDIPSAILFRGGRHQSAEFDRTVTITPTNEHEFRFHQTIRWKRNEEVETIEDEFPLRYWPEDFVAGILEDVGFLQKTDLTSLFPETGARYWMLSRGN